jgi:hypothetical protein
VLDDDEALLLFETTGVELDALARTADEVAGGARRSRSSPTS